MSSIQVFISWIFGLSACIIITMTLLATYIRQEYNIWCHEHSMSQSCPNNQHFALIHSVQPGLGLVHSPFADRCYHIPSHNRLSYSDRALKQKTSTNVLNMHPFYYMIQVRRYKELRLTHSLEQQEMISKMPYPQWSSAPELQLENTAGYGWLHSRCTP